MFAFQSLELLLGPGSQNYVVLLLEEQARDGQAYPSACSGYDYDLGRHVE